MPGRPKPSSHREKTDGTGSKEYEKESATIFCSLDECFNFKNLKTCTQCKTAVYCVSTIPTSTVDRDVANVALRSRKNVKQDWKKHKAVCNHNSGVMNGISNESIFQSNLRHWAARFHTTLLMASIRALNLREDWDRINQGAIVIFLEPRPHVNKGARWRISLAGVYPFEEIYPVLEKLGALEEYRDKLLPMHNEARQKLRESSGGTSDYTSVITVASNIGRDALQGDYLPTFRFTPLDVHRDLIEKMPERYFGVDWLESLRFEVEEDHPLKSVPL
ncbi:MYND-type domain-containing protein [Favolaschia claudopus]|uniref:MYND-type domain-containing protein n=1 Tax=Favolaschia claudopus TaxID=2862362 RepID=A0AAW0A6R0_9AGAR